MQLPRAWVSKTSRDICERTRLDDPQVAVRYLARQILGADSEIPTNLKLIAKQLKVMSVVEEPLPFDGMLVREKGLLSIKLNSRSHYLRRRFTLAHEIGHIILATGQQHDDKWKRQTCTGVEVEKLCDAAASELLMPEWEVRDFFASKEVSPETVSAFASRFQVSLEAASTRIRELKLTEGTLSLMQREEDFYFKKLWPKRIGNVRFNSSLFLPPLQQCFTDKRQFGGRVFLDALGREVFLEAIRLGSSEFVLVLLSR